MTLLNRYPVGQATTQNSYITRNSAVGIRANYPAYSGVARDRLDGFLASQEADAWNEAILRLAGHECPRGLLLTAATM